MVRQNLASLSKLQANNSKSTLDGYKWHIVKTGGTDGLIFTPDELTVGETYTFSCKFQKTSGTLTVVGGHAEGFTQKAFIIDGIAQTVTYMSGEATVPDDDEIHEIVFTGTYKGTSSNNNLYFQPNRKKSTATSCYVWDIKVEQGETATAWIPGEKWDSLQRAFEAGYAIARAIYGILSEGEFEVTEEDIKQIVERVMDELTVKSEPTVFLPEITLDNFELNESKGQYGATTSGDHIEGAVTSLVENMNMVSDSRGTLPVVLEIDGVPQKMTAYYYYNSAIEDYLVWVGNGSLYSDVYDNTGESFAVLFMISMCAYVTTNADDAISHTISIYQEGERTIKTELLPKGGFGYTDTSVVALLPAVTIDNFQVQEGTGYSLGYVGGENLISAFNSITEKMGIVDSVNDVGELPIAVEVDGTIYNVTAHYIYDSVFLTGNIVFGNLGAMNPDRYENTGEPFVALMDVTSIGFYYEGEATSHTVAIFHETETVHTIDKKYIS